MHPDPDTARWTSESSAENPVGITGLLRNPQLDELFDLQADCRYDERIAIMESSR